MRFIITIIILIVTQKAVSQKAEIVYNFYDFESIADGTLFRSTSLYESNKLIGEIITTIPKGAIIELLEEAEENDNGPQKRYLKAKYMGQSGYINKQDLLVARIKIDNIRKMNFAYKEIGSGWALEIDLYQNEIVQTTRTDTLANQQFIINVSNNRGVDRIEKVVYIDYLAEACGVSGGGIYYFIDDQGLHKAIELNSISEAGLYWYEQKIVFPNDENNWSSEIILSTEKGEYITDEFTWVKSVKEERAYEWNGISLLPKMLKK